MRTEGLGLQLRMMNLADAKKILAWENQKDVVKVSGHEGGYSLQDIQDFILHAKDIYLDKQLRLMICAQEAIGTLDLYSFCQESKSAGVGILIGNVAYRRKGIGTAAIDLLKNYCRNELGLERLWVEIQKDNVSSLRFFEKQSFKLRESNADILLLDLIL